VKDCRLSSSTIHHFQAQLESLENLRSAFVTASREVEAKYTVASTTHAACNCVYVPLKVCVRCEMVQDKREQQTVVKIKDGQIILLRRHN